MNELPRTTTTITRVDGTTVDIEHVDYDAVLDQWDALGPEAWFLDSGDLHNVVDVAVARAEASEAKLDEQIEAAIALRHDLDTLRDLYGAAEARIAAALEWLRGTHPARVSYALAALVEPVGEPPRRKVTDPPSTETLHRMSEEPEPTATLIMPPGAPIPVGDPQPPTCAECQDERWVCDKFGHGLCRDPRCVVNRRPCPSCAPTEPGDAT